MYRRWETPTRYYTATVIVDLLGNIVMVRRWGGLSNARGGEATVLLADQSAASSQLRKLARRRQARGYRLVAEN